MRVTGDLQHDDTVPQSGSGREPAPSDGAWSKVERALLDAALEFYGAAEGVIDFAGRDRPQLRHDAAGFKAIRRAMAALEERIRGAHAAGLALERIVEIARIEPEMVALIIAREGAAAPSPDEG